MATLRINQGESLTFAIVFQESQLSNIEDIAISIGSIIVGKLSAETIKQDTQVSTRFLCCIESQTTQMFCDGTYDIGLAVDWKDVGVRKQDAKTVTKLKISENPNPFANSAVSGIPTFEIAVTITEQIIEAEVVLGVIVRGMNALEMFRAEKNLPNATLDMMIEYYSPNKRIPVTNIQDGTVIALPDGMTGKVAVQFYEQDGNNYVHRTGFYSEYQDNTHFIFKTPVFDDLLNSTFTGVILCTKLN